MQQPQYNVPFATSPKHTVQHKRIMYMPLAIDEDRISSQIASESRKIQIIRKLNRQYMDYINAHPLMFPLYIAKSMADYRNHSLIAEIDAEEYDGILQDFITEHGTYNRKLYEKYRQQAERAANVVTRFRYQERQTQIQENAQFNELLIPYPLYCVKEAITYTSPKGYHCVRRAESVQAEDWSAVYEEAVDLSDKRKAHIIERKKMSRKLRYAVLKRDGHRCVICGRGRDDGVKLHVDHILPVSKGGKTVMENLRTLCDDCNSGKSDSYDPDYSYAGQIKDETDG